MTLREKQSMFATKIAELILWVNLGCDDPLSQTRFAVTLGDAYRDPRCPYGSKSSKHRRRLAVDLNLFIDGVYRTDADSHKRIGEKWESMGGIWGGRWGDDPATPMIEGRDANHYEWPD